MATRPHQLFSLFSNSDRCQVMATMALGNCQKRCRFIPLPWPKSWLLGSCPGAWATTAVDIRTNFGNYQGFMYDHSSYWCDRAHDDIDLHARLGAVPRSSTLNGTERRERPHELLAHTLAHTGAVAVITGAEMRGDELCRRRSSRR